MLWLQRLVDIAESVCRMAPDARSPEKLSIMAAPQVMSALKEATLDVTISSHLADTGTDRQPVYWPAWLSVLGTCVVLGVPMSVLFEAYERLLTGSSMCDAVQTSAGILRMHCAIISLVSVVRARAHAPGTRPVDLSTSVALRASVLNALRVHRDGLHVLDVSPQVRQAVFNAYSTLEGLYSKR